MKQSIYYIETTLNGYIIKKIKICEFIEGKDYIEDLIFNLDGEEVDYYQDIAGDYDDLDKFLGSGSNYDCDNYDNVLNTQDNVYLEYWKTLELGYYTNKFVGLIVEKELI